MAIPLRKRPGVPALAALAVSIVLGALIVATAPIVRARGIPLPSREKQWSIGVYAGRSPLAIDAAPDVSNPVLTARDVTDVRAAFVADPFMIHDGSTWHMFFEVFDTESRRGKIGLATSEDGRKWRYRQIVLAESQHLSYPYVFCWNSTYYMIPESGAMNSVRLYRASTFPTSWTYVTTLLGGKAFADSSIVRHGGRWWLFTESSGGELSLYFADALEGPFRPHPLSPIVRGARDAARPAGRLVEADGRLIRYAQQDFPRYGTQVWAFEIHTLSPDRYEETRLGSEPIVLPSGRGWNQAGMHHVDAHYIGEGGWLASVDGYRHAWTFGIRRWPSPSGPAP